MPLTTDLSVQMAKETSEVAPLLPKGYQDEDKDPHGEPAEKSTFAQAMMNFLKGCVASGFLSLPYALSKSGYALGTAALVVICLISTHCVHLLIEAKEFLCKRVNRTQMSFGGMAKESMGRNGERFTNIFIVTCQLGFCCVYVLFYIENMTQVFPSLSKTTHTLILTPCLIALSWIKSLRILSLPSLLGTLCILYAATLIYIYCVQHLLEYGEHRTPATSECSDTIPFSSNFSGNFTAPCLASSLPVPVAPLASFPLMFGNAIYAFEAIGLVLPIQNSMTRRQDFGLMLNVSMVLVFVMYTSFALLGYLVFGGSTAGTITLNLPNTLLFQSAKVSLSVMMLQSYAIQFYPAITILEHRYLVSLKALFGSGFATTVVRHLLRTMLVGLTIGLALLIPHIGLVISLMGSLGAGALSLVLPPLIHMKAMWDSLSRARIALDLFYLVFGVIGSAVGTGVAIQQIIKTFQE